MGQLTATRIKTLTEPSRYIEGMMEIVRGGSRSWTDFLEKRKALMADWGAFCGAGSSI